MKGRWGSYRWLGRIFWVGVAGGLLAGWYYVDRMIPDRVSIVEEEKEDFSFPLPFFTTLSSDSQEVALGNESNIPADQITISGNQPFSMYAGNEGSYEVGLKLFGLIKFKEIQVNVVQTRYAVPCGAPIGIYLESDGILVVGTGKLTGEDGEEIEPAKGILKSGDYIEAFNGKPLDTKEELIQAVDDSHGEAVTLSVRREGQMVDVSLDPVKTQDGSYKLGAWVRDDTQGIGTVTYVDLNGGFGALGHGISDSDTGEVVSIEEGALYETQIMGIEKGSPGKPGVMSGVIYYGPASQLGTVTANTEEGIFGTAGEELRNQLAGEALPIGYRQDVHTGEAVIRSSVSGEVKDYKIEIQKVDYSTSHKNKGMVIKVVDEELLNLTGGIVQGMSGSPIIQDGKLVGAVTHVFVQDSTRGYGIFIENMLAH